MTLYELFPIKRPLKIQKSKVKSLSANPTKLSDTLKQFVDKCRRIV